MIIVVTVNVTVIMTIAQLGATVTSLRAMAACCLASCIATSSAAAICWGKLGQDPGTHLNWARMWSGMVGWGDVMCHGTTQCGTR